MTPTFISLARVIPGTLFVESAHVDGGPSGPQKPPGGIVDAPTKLELRIPSPPTVIDDIRRAATPPVAKPKTPASSPVNKQIMESDFGPAWSIKKSECPFA